MIQYMGWGVLETRCPKFLPLDFPGNAARFNTWRSRASICKRVEELKGKFPGMDGKIVSY